MVDAAVPADIRHPLLSPTSSMSVTETVNGSHLFVIQGYSLAKGIGIGKHIASEKFTVGGYQWAIYFYPDGRNQEDNSTYVSVFIVLESEGTDDTRALFELTLVDQSGKGKHKVHSHFDRSLENGPYTLNYRGCMWGYNRFFRRVMLETSDYLKDDCLRINCTVGVVVSAIVSSISPSLTVPDSDIGAHFGMLLDNLEGSDVVFPVSGEKFPASSMSVTETVNGSHQFVIQKYSLAKGIGIGKHIASENFTAGGYQWAIYFYPDGKNQEDNSTYVSAFIALASEGTDVRALFELTLVNQSRKGKQKVHSHFDRSLENGPYTFKYRGSMWGCKRFIRRDMLETSDYLKDDCLLIRCTVGVVVSGIDSSISPSLTVPASDIGAHSGCMDCVTVMLSIF